MTFAILALLPLVLPLYAVRFHVGPLPTTGLEVALLVMLAAWTVAHRFAGWTYGIKDLKRRGLLLPIGLWLVAGLVGIVIAPDHVAALGLFRAYFLEPALVFFMLADLVRRDADVKTLLRSLILVCVGVAIWAAVQTVTGQGIPSPWNAPPSGIRATGPFPFPNALALFTVPIAALCISCLQRTDSRLRGNDKMKIWLWIGFTSGLLATLLAKSDGGLVALAAAAFVALVLKTKTRIPTLIVTTVLIIAALAVPQTRTMITDQALFREWSGKVRVVMWQETLAMLKDRPVFGAGLGAYPDVIKPYHKATWMEIFQYPHDILLNLWSEVGILGIIAFAWILLRWWREGGSLALPVIVAILVHGLVDVPYFKNDLAVMFWVLVVVTTFRFAQTETFKKAS
jgi:O-antigen ligase